MAKKFIVLFSALLLLAISASFVSAAPTIVGAITNNEIDNFYYDGQTATFNVSVVWAADTAGNLTVNCAALGDSAAKLAINITGLTGATNYTANCTVNYTNIPAQLNPTAQPFIPIAGGNITFVAYNSSSSPSPPGEDPCGSSATPC